MMKAKLRWWVALFVLAFFLPAQFGAAFSGGLFENLKTKVAKKIDQMKQKDWWFTKVGSKALGFVTGKAAGILGLGVGALVGLTMGGPVGAAVGAWLGYKLFDIATRTFVRPVGEAVIDSVLHKKPFQIKGIFKGLDKKALAMEGGAVFLGSIVGEVLGVVAGAALLAGVGPIAIPVLGVISGAYLGKKIGKSIGGMLGRFSMKKLAQHKLNKSTTDSSSTTDLKLSSNNGISASTELTDLQRDYEAAYKAYVAAQNDPNVSKQEVDRLLGVYQAAFNAYQTNTSGIISK